MLSVLQPAKLPCSLNSHDISMNTLRHNDVGTSTRLSLHRFDSFASSEDSTSSNYDHDYGSKPAHIFTSSQGKEVARFRSIVDSWSSTASFSSLLHTITIAVPPTCIRELSWVWLTVVLAGILSSSGKRVTKARWSSDEDDKLKKLVDKHGLDDFQKIASFFEVSEPWKNCYVTIAWHTW